MKCCSFYAGNFQSEEHFPSCTIVIKWTMTTFFRCSLIRKSCENFSFVIIKYFQNVKKNPNKENLLITYLGSLMQVWTPAVPGTHS